MTIHNELVEIEGGFSLLYTGRVPFVRFGLRRQPRVIQIWQWLHRLGKMVAAKFHSVERSKAFMHWKVTESFNLHSDYSLMLRVLASRVYTG